MIIIASLTCLGCDLPSAHQARDIALEKQKMEISSMYSSNMDKRKHNVCNNQHAKYRENQIRAAIKRGERSAYIYSQTCIEKFFVGCVSERISCRTETEAFLEQLEKKGYKVRPSPEYLRNSYEVSW